MKIYIQALILIAVGFYLGTARAQAQVHYANAQVENMWKLYNVCLEKEVAYEQR